MNLMHTKFHVFLMLMFLASPNLLVFHSLHAQVTTAFTANTAFSVLNKSTASSPAGNTYTSQAVSLSSSQATIIVPQNYNKSWIINYGIPIQVSLDYSYLRARMVTAYEEDPGIYHRGSNALKQAVDILGWADFVKISSWAPVNCKVNYRFIPPALGAQGSSSFKYSYQFNPLSAPIRGSNTFYIR